MAAAYKPKVLLGPGIALLVFSIFLLALYIGCSITVCRHEASSLYSPIWTSVIGTFLAAFGIGITLSKRGNKLSITFMALCIVYIFVCITCMILALIASVTESTHNIFDENDNSTGYERSTAQSLWVGIAVVSLALVITAGITSCMFCCCREQTSGPQPQVNQVLVLQQAQQAGNQPIVLQPQPTGAQTVMIVGAPSTGPPPNYFAQGAIQQPNTTVLNGPPPAAQGAVPVISPGVSPGAPPVSASDNQPPPLPYMYLQHNTTGDSTPTVHAASEDYEYAEAHSYTYIDPNRLQTPDERQDSRRRLPTPDEEHDAPEYTYTDTERRPMVTSTQNANSGYVNSIMRT